MLIVTVITNIMVMECRFKSLIGFGTIIANCTIFECEYVPRRDIIVVEKVGESATFQTHKSQIPFRAAPAYLTILSFGEIPRVAECQGSGGGCGDQCGCGAGCGYGVCVCVLTGFAMDLKLKFDSD